MNMTNVFHNLAEQKKLRKPPAASPVAQSYPTHAPHTMMARLQQQVGNQALGRLGQSQSGDSVHMGNVLQRLVTGPIQAKLTLGPVGDRYEQEADQVAKQVVQQMHQPTQPVDAVQREAGLEEEEMQMKPQAIQMLQREALPEEEEMQMKPVADLQREGELDEEELVQDKRLTADIQREELPDEEELQAKPLIQRMDMAGGGEVGEDVEAAIRSSRGGGQSMSDTIRAPMENAFGAAFGGVRVHTGAESDALNQTLQARAFTTGQDIFFRQGEYNPHSSGGQELLAHELTHVVQQNGPAVQREEQ